MSVRSSSRDQMVDGMLKDEDKADTVEGEEEVIAQRRAFVLSSFFRGL